MNEKIKLALAKLSGMNIAHALVLVLVAKAIILDVSWPSVLLTVPVLGYDAYQIFLKSKKPNPVALNDEYRRELDQVKSKLSALTMDKNVQPTKSRYF